MFGLCPLQFCSKIIQGFSTLIQHTSTLITHFIASLPALKLLRCSDPVTCHPALHGDLGPSVSSPGTGRDKSLQAGIENGSLSQLHGFVGHEVLGWAVQSSGVPSLHLKETLDQMCVSWCSFSQIYAKWQVSGCSMLSLSQLHSQGILTTWSAMLDVEQGRSHDTASWMAESTAECVTEVGVWGLI